MKKRKLAHAFHMRTYRAKKKEGKEKEKILRSVPRQLHIDAVISEDLGKISHFTMKDRMAKVKEKFRTIMSYKSKVSQWPYIIQYLHHSVLL